MIAVFLAAWLSFHRLGIALAGVFGLAIVEMFVGIVVIVIAGSRGKR
jgi:hypothetical protein